MGVVVVRGVHAAAVVVVVGKAGVSSSLVRWRGEEEESAVAERGSESLRWLTF